MKDEKVMILLRTIIREMFVDQTFEDTVDIFIEFLKQVKELNDFNALKRALEYMLITIEERESAIRNTSLN